MADSSVGFYLRNNNVELYRKLYSEYFIASDVPEESINAVLDTVCNIVNTENSKGNYEN